MVVVGVTAVCGGASRGSEGGGRSEVSGGWCNRRSRSFVSKWLCAVGMVSAGADEGAEDNG